MRCKSAILLFPCLLVLAGCIGVGREDSRIVAQCGWLEDSATANISMSGTLSAFIFGGGASYSKQATLYSSEDAGDRDLLLSACKMNALGSPQMTDERYSEVQAQIIALRAKRVGLDLGNVGTMSQQDLDQLAKLSGTTTEKIARAYKEVSAKSDAQRETEYNNLSSDISNMARTSLDRLDRMDGRLNIIADELHTMRASPDGGPIPDLFVYFDYNRDVAFADLQSTFGTMLVQARARGLEAQVDGFADEQGTSGRSGELSLRRARYVARLLQQASIKIKSINGNGKTRRFGDAYSANRVVRIKFVAEVEQAASH